jgi:hypothetical protein
VPLRVPVVVLTHQPPTDWRNPGAENFSFRHRWNRGRRRPRSAGRRREERGRRREHHCLEAGLLDEVVVDLVPIVMGKGRHTPASYLRITHSCWLTLRHSPGVSSKKGVTR